MYHFIHFKMYNSEALKYIDKRTVYNHHHHPSPELLHFPQIETLYPLKSNSPSHLSSSLAATILPPVSISLNYSQDFLEYLSFVYGLFNIMSSRFNHVVAHVRISFLFKSWIMFHHMYRPHLFIHTSVDGLWGCFHLWAIVIMQWLLKSKYLLESVLSVHLGVHPEVETAG